MASWSFPPQSPTQIQCQCQPSFTYLRDSSFGVLLIWAFFGGFGLNSDFYLTCFGGLSVFSCCLQRTPVARRLGSGYDCADRGARWAKYAIPFLPSLFFLFLSFSLPNVIFSSFLYVILLSSFLLFVFPFHMQPHLLSMIALGTVVCSAARLGSSTSLGSW
jgi:hypothetical protein